MKTEEYDDFTLIFDDSPEAKERIYEMCLNSFRKIRRFSGESVAQCDAGNIEGVELFCALADEGFKFERKWKN